MGFPESHGQEGPWTKTQETLNICYLLNWIRLNSLSTQHTHVRLPFRKPHDSSFDQGGFIALETCRRVCGCIVTEEESCESNRKAMRKTGNLRSSAKCSLSFCQQIPPHTHTHTMRTHLHFPSSHIGSLNSPLKACFTLKWSMFLFPFIHKKRKLIVYA